MKQKSINDNSSVKKGQLQIILRNYPTKKDVDDAFKAFEKQIRKDFDKEQAERLIKSQHASRVESDYKFRIMQEDLDIKFSKFTNRILTAIDPLLQELKTRHEEREITTGQITELRDTSNDHEKRINKLEHS